MSDELRGRWQWKSMPFAGYTGCAVCNRQVYCYGKTWERMVCLDCFTTDQTSARLRRSGKTGPRAGYTFDVRRSRAETIALVRTLHHRGLVIPAIAETANVSEATVRQYLRPSAPYRGAQPSNNGVQTRSLTHENATQKKTEGGR
jgi:hypothetical protein